MKHEHEQSSEIIEMWYHTYSDDIYRYILMLTGDHELAKDLMHDTFLKAFKSVDTFQGRSSDKNWLYQIARNVTIDYKRKKKPVQYAIETFFSLASDFGCPDQITMLGETEEVLFKSLKKLKRPYQDVIILRKIKDLTIKETAEILGWKESKVKTTLFRGLDALRKQMEKEGYVNEKR